MTAAPARLILCISTAKAGPDEQGARLAVSFGTMAGAEDPHGVPIEREQDAVIAKPEAEGACHIAAQCAYVARTGSREMEYPLEQAHGGWAVHAANVGLGFIEPLNTLGRHYCTPSGECGKSSGLRSNSARTSSIGTPLLPGLANHACPS